MAGYPWPWLTIKIDGVDVSQYVKTGSVSTNRSTGGKGTASFTLIGEPGADPISEDVGYPEVWTDTFTITSETERLWFTTFYVAGLPTVTVNGVPQVASAIGDVGSTPGWMFYYIPNSPGISHNQSEDALEIGDVIEFTYPVAVPSLGLSASPRYGGAKIVEIIHKPTEITEFKGVIDSTQSELTSGPRGLEFTQTQCVDFGVLMDRRVVRAVFSAEGVGSPASGGYGTVESIVRKLVDVYFASLGITYDDHPVTPNAVGTMAFNADKGGDAMRKLCDAAGCDFYVDDNLAIQLISGDGVGTGAAPFAIEQNDGNWRRLVRTDVNTRFWNKAIVRTTRNVDPVQKITFTVGDEVTDQIRAFFDVLTPGTQLNAEVNGVETGVSAVFVSAYGLNGVQFDDPSVLTEGASITLSSVADIDAVAVAADEASIAAVGLVEYVREIRDVPDAEALQAIANAVLAEGLDTIPDCSIDTFRPGLKPGQALTVNANGVNEIVLVQQVDMNDGDQGFPRYTIKTSGRPKRKPTANEALTRMLQNSKTGVDRVTNEIRFKLAESIAGFDNPGVTAAALEDGAVAIAAKKGLARRAVMYFKAGAGCKIDVLKNGVSIFQGGGIQWLGAGPVYTSLFNGSPLKIAVGDIFTLSIVNEDATSRDGYLSVEYMG